jgi:hypothetical protein
MKKLIILGTVIALAAALMTGCSAVFHTTNLGNMIDKTYDFKDFTKIELSNSFQYDIKQADNYSVVISAPQNELDRIDIRQSGDSLIVTMRYIPFLSSNPRITVTMPQLNKLAASDSCEGSAIGFNSNNNLEIDLHSSSRLNMDITAAKTTVDISGSSNISGNLTAADTQINVSSSSRLDMDLITAKTGIDISGSSHASGKLTAADTQIKVNSSSELDMSMKTGVATISAAASSTIRGSLDAQDCTFTINSSSRCELTGSAGNTNIEATGSSTMSASGLILKSADVTLESSSRAGIYTNGTLNLDISGSSTLDYYGNPSIGKTNINSSSRLNHK